MNEDLISRADTSASQEIGEWKVHNDYHPNLKYGCNRCGNLTNIPSNYCPNCGKTIKKGGAE